MLRLLLGDFEGKLTSGKWAKICKVSSDTALRDINDLIGKGCASITEALVSGACYILGESMKYQSGKEATSLSLSND